MRTAKYKRVSTEESLRGYFIAAQKKQLLASRNSRIYNGSNVL